MDYGVNYAIVLTHVASEPQMKTVAQSSIERKEDVDAVKGQ